jgi:hypothetical protein
MNLTLVYIFLWFLYEKLVKLLSGPKFSRKWNANIVSSTHGILLVLKCYFMMFRGWDITNSNLLRFSATYFLFDLKNHNTKSMFFWHHLLSITALWFITQKNVDTEITIKGYMFTELGNIPLFVMYGLLTHYNKSYLNQWYKPVLIFQFIWFVFFRILVIAYYMLQLKLPISWLVGFGIQSANIKWTLGLFRKLKSLK